MTVPGRVESAALLLSLDPPPWFLRHARAVAEIAAWLAARTRATGVSVDARLVDAAALLHDADKILPDGGPDRPPLAHGEGSAAWLARMGFPELGPAVAGHPVTLLAAAGGIDAVLAAPDEVRIVAYADKRAGQRLEPLAARLASWDRRYPVDRADAEARLRVERMRAGSAALEDAVCRRALVRPEEVRRVAWTGRALAAARAVERP
jgi:HD domain